MHDASSPVAVDHPYVAAIDRERERFEELHELIDRLSQEQRERPGYFRDDLWSVKDLVSHLGSWMAEAEIQLLRIEAGTYVEETLDIDAMNAEFLAALRDQSWLTCWNQCLAARAQMLSVWSRLHVQTEAADRWVRKSGADHLDEHLPRLGEWVAELRA
jgi:chromatin segregation and condensation protein Rec8/ScpA/Scc1 (kleisin family)